jgi:cbb3-type cytochrome oxidase subunit 3
MWKSWFLSTSLADLGLPAMFIFMGVFVLATWRALRTPDTSINDAAALPLADDNVVRRSP